MNTKYFTLYLMIAFAGLIFLALDSFIGYREIEPGRVLLIAIPDMVFFFLAYKTHPEAQQSSADAR